MHQLIGCQQAQSISPTTTGDSNYLKWIYLKHRGSWSGKDACKFLSSLVQIMACLFFSAKIFPQQMLAWHYRGHKKTFDILQTTCWNAVSSKKFCILIHSSLKFVPGAASDSLAPTKHQAITWMTNDPNLLMVLWPGHKGLKFAICPRHHKAAIFA